MLGRGGSVLDLAAHCNRLSPRPGNLTRFQGDARELPGKTAVDRKPPAMVHARLARSLDRARERGQRGPFSRHRGGASCQGSRCNTGAAPATVTGDKVRQIHWATSLGRAERRTIRQARRPTARAPAAPQFWGVAVRLATPRGAEARRLRPRRAVRGRFFCRAPTRRTHATHRGIWSIGREARRPRSTAQHEQATRNLGTHLAERGHQRLGVQQ